MYWYINMTTKADPLIQKTVLLILTTPGSTAGPCFSPFFGWWASATMHAWSELGNYHLLIHERGYYGWTAWKRQPNCLEKAASWGKTSEPGENQWTRGRRVQKVYENSEKTRQRWWQSCWKSVRQAVGFTSNERQRGDEKNVWVIVQGFFAGFTSLKKVFGGLEQPRDKWREVARW